MNRSIAKTQENQIKRDWEKSRLQRVMTNWEAALGGDIRNRGKMGDLLVKEQSTEVKLARMHENQGLQNKTGNDGISVIKGIQNKMQNMLSRLRLLSIVEDDDFFVAFF